ncbi:MAG: exosortase family protein XrtF [Xanthomarina sp.]
MKELILKYKAVIKFILTFLLVYAVLTFLYTVYLEYGSSKTYYPDYITNLVAKQSKELLEVLGYKTQITPHPHEPSMKLIVNNKYLARVIEGCNAVSVIILFASFIIAFSGRLKTTVLYILLGSVLIYITNLLRIVILTIGLYHYPWREHVLHTVIFPAIIYGMVCMLWLFWISRFSNSAKSHE